jgi:aminoglycoside phosphotransferase family enzyme/gluconate kinase
MTADEPKQPELIRSLLQPAVYEHPVTEIQLIETHISWVILTGDYVYKIKKPVNLGFLDFSTLPRRRFCCNEELRLNSRLAAEIYLDVVAIAGTPAKPLLHGDGEVIEYAVKMVQFPQQAQLDNMLAAGRLENRHIDALAEMVAKFHQQTDIASADSSFGDPQQVYHPVAENFSQIREHLVTNSYDDQLAQLEDWSKSAFAALVPVFEQRKHQGYIRECHGDMHLRNLVWFNNKPMAFDCLEFNPALRWIDTVSEVAFLVMDLQDRNQPALARRLLNNYLQQCGDYPGIQVLNFYLVYRALVRAKVDAIRAAQPGIMAAEKNEAENEFQAYLQLASSYTQQQTPKLIITHGMSASGKSTLTQPLLETMGAIRIRSDVERKRLFGIDPAADSKSGIDAGIYSTEAGTKTYAKLRELAGVVLDAGFTVIIDAAFLKNEQRQPFQQLACEKQVPFIILQFTAPAEILRQRIKARAHDVSEADLAVLEHQLVSTKPLSADDKRYLISVDTEASFDAARLAIEIDRDADAQTNRVCR